MNPPKQEAQRLTRAREGCMDLDMVIEVQERGNKGAVALKGSSVKGFPPGI